MAQTWQLEVLSKPCSRTKHHLVSAKVMPVGDTRALCASKGSSRQVGDQEGRTRWGDKWMINLGLQRGPTNTTKHLRLDIRASRLFELNAWSTDVRGLTEMVSRPS